MLESLNFVKGAVAKKDLVPAMTHFHIAGGRIQSYNGKISLSAPIALDVDCCPKADPFVRAIEACTETAQLHLTPSGKLAIRSGKFRAHIDSVPEDLFPELAPEGEIVPVDGELLPALAYLYELVGEDASRPWATGILLDGASAFATNNVALAECWLGYNFPFKVVIPKYTIKEMIRIGEEPTQVQLTANSATFHYEGDRWLRTQLMSNDWPNIREMLDQAAPDNASPISAEFWQALGTLRPFIDEMARVYLQPGSASTQLEEGISVEVPDQTLIGIYNLKVLALLEPLATKINWSTYPNRVAWSGKKIRGLIVGMRR